MLRLRTLLLAAAVVLAALAPARAGIMVPGPESQPCDPEVETCPPACDPEVGACPAAGTAEAGDPSWQAVVLLGARAVVVHNISLLP